MDLSFVTVTGWSSHQTSSPRSSVVHSRSLSSLMRSSSPKPTRTPAKSSSVSDMPKTVASDGFDPNRGCGFPPPDEADMSTLPDPRRRAVRSTISQGQSSSHHHHDHDHDHVDDEVTTLSTKLIKAINHQTAIDDNLSVTRAELENAHEQIRILEQKVATQQDMLASHVWIKRSSVEAEKTALLGRIADEKKAKHEVEQQKRKMEQELENLTAALFEEANKMVISAKEDARAEQEALHRKNDQLKAQLADSDVLLKFQQEQLTELKQMMEHMNSDRDDQTFATLLSSPGLSRLDLGDIQGGHDDLGVSNGALEPPSPSHPTSFTYLLQPVLRTDTAAFTEFRDLVRISKRLSSQSTASFNSVGGLSSSSLAKPSSATATASPPAPNALKDTKFYKRVLVEDIEPTLRLDLAPGLSWLARRAVVTAILEGSLVVEPVPSISPTSRFVNPQTFACTLCGDARREERHLRKHRFRSSEASSSQRYPLCKYCLVRVRSTCDLLGFLRIVKDGHWGAEDEAAEKAAWEESVRLREQMFWARIGGGVLPAGAVGHHASAAGRHSVAPSLRGLKSARTSTDGEGQDGAAAGDVPASAAGAALAETSLIPEASEEPDDVPKPETTPVHAGPKEAEDD
ncbi:hypothetical protein P8C59_009231 [Phyllachora maydis]|uniref:GDP/GTP exchange factor Sec2 N-terminal domain-containing protein n=1 Tax=Phyllachora maydis TaxID=1825666 RepID=A0AAD9ICQ2_9PEZI|nr:hypothetical protein P8C59_009231 [Phyllachora maydis]